MLFAFGTFKAILELDVDDVNELLFRIALFRIAGVGLHNKHRPIVCSTVPRSNHRIIIQCANQLSIYWCVNASLWVPS